MSCLAIALAPQQLQAVVCFYEGSSKHRMFMLLTAYRRAHSCWRSLIRAEDLRKCHQPSSRRLVCGLSTRHPGPRGTHSVTHTSPSQCRLAWDAGRTRSRSGQRMTWLPPGTSRLDWASLLGQRKLRVTRQVDAATRPPASRHGLCAITIPSARS